mgnify:FL=1
MKTRIVGNNKQEYYEEIRYEDYRENNKENIDLNIQLVKIGKKGWIEDQGRVALKEIDIGQNKDIRMPRIVKREEK